MRITDSLLATLFAAAAVRANTPIAGSKFSEDNGINAANEAAPMWYLPGGTCLPSAAEDGKGHQTNGNDADNCNILELNHNCPAEPERTGDSTWYGNVEGEPFAEIPTYYKTQWCDGDQSWRIIYYVYFKKDTGHMSDWEGLVITFTGDGSDQFWRTSVIMEQDGDHPSIYWGDVNDTYEGDDWGNWGQKNLDHGKFYFGKFHHSVHDDQYHYFPQTCPPNSASDYRDASFYFWANNNLRHTSVLDPNWDWGKADSPANIDLCTY